MRQLLTDDGLPFSGSRVLQDQRDVIHPGVRHVTRYITIYAVQTGELATADVDVTLLDGELDEEVLLATTEVKKLATAGDITTVLERYPMRGPVGLRVDADPTVMCFGFVELDPSEERAFPNALRHELFSLTPQNGLVGDTAQTVHLFSPIALHEITLMVDVPPQRSVELRFVSENDEVSFEIVGPLAAFQLLERIPVLTSGRIDALAAEGPCAVYGYIVRR